jgi:hypothetical protein
VAREARATRAVRVQDAPGWGVVRGNPRVAPRRRGAREPPVFATTTWRRPPMQSCAASTANAVSGPNTVCAQVSRRLAAACASRLNASARARQIAMPATRARSIRSSVAVREVPYPRAVSPLVRRPAAPPTSAAIPTTACAKRARVPTDTSVRTASFAISTAQEKSMGTAVRRCAAKPASSALRTRVASRARVATAARYSLARRTRTATAGPASIGSALPERAPVSTFQSELGMPGQ